MNKIPQKERVGELFPGTRGKLRQESEMKKERGEA